MEIILNTKVGDEFHEASESLVVRFATNNRFIILEYGG